MSVANRKARARRNLPVYVTVARAVGKWHTDSMTYTATHQVERLRITNEPSGTQLENKNLAADDSRISAAGE